MSYKMDREYMDWVKAINMVEDRLKTLREKRAKATDIRVADNILKLIVANEEMLRLLKAKRKNWSFQ